MNSLNNDKKWVWALSFWFGYPIVQALGVNINKNITFVLFFSTLVTIWAAAGIQNLVIGQPKFTEVVYKKLPSMKLVSFFIFGIMFNVIVLMGIYLFETIFSSSLTQQGVVLDFLKLSVVEKSFFIIFVSFFVPFAEEIIYRHFILRWLRSLFSNINIVLLANGLWFGLSHYLFDLSAPIVILPLTVFGMIASKLAIKHDSILPSVLFHCGFNLTAAILLFLQ